MFISAPEALRDTLREQYRMHPHIMHCINHFYPDKDGKGSFRSDEKYLGEVIRLEDGGCVRSNYRVQGVTAAPGAGR